ncbi:MAG: hypothetical protein IJM85_01080, partial [Clostridia bacterium]|nr:hypothetical protein [Clostridia bacterium]
GKETLSSQLQLSVASPPHQSCGQLPLIGEAMRRRGLRLRDRSACNKCGILRVFSHKREGLSGAFGAALSIATE